MKTSYAALGGLLLLFGNEIISLAVLAVFGCVGVSKLLKVMYEGGFY